MIADANRYVTLTYGDGLVTVACALCSAFELVLERSERGQKTARERSSLHLRCAHECRSC